MRERKDLIIPFYKYQATGNDFIIIDQFNERFFDQLTQEQIERLCHRKFGIGADGLMIIEPAIAHDFRMVYYNSDGRPSSMCGNGGRAISHLVYNLGYTHEKGNFIAVDGKHDVIIAETQVELKMNNVSKISRYSNDYILDTGSPHYIKITDRVEEMHVVTEAHKIRYNTDFKAEGINVNFVEVQDDHLYMRTYERGVEDETLSCGTGVTAAAIIYMEQQPAHPTITQEVFVKTRGGTLKVRATKTEEGYEDIWLCGPTAKVFEGIIEL